MSNIKKSVFKYLQEIDKTSASFLSNEIVLKISKEFKIPVSKASDLYSDWIDSIRGIQDDIEC